MDWAKNNFPYIPLLVFVFLGYNGGAESVEQWGVAWRAGALLALAALALTSQDSAPTDRIFVGVNSFLLIGGALAWLGAGQALALYGGYLRGVSLFLVIFLTGLVYTFNGPGFVNAKHGEPPQVRRCSIQLLLLTLVCMLFAWLFRGSMLYEGTLPFFALYIGYLALNKKADESGDTA